MNTTLLELDGVLFDLDGVLTSTSVLHATAWKTTFDAVLEELAAADWGPQRPFDDADYRRYVDGRFQVPETRAGRRRNIGRHRSVQPYRWVRRRVWALLGGSTRGQGPPASRPCS